jgi:hypothetical protein
MTMQAPHGRWFATIATLVLAFSFAALREAPAADIAWFSFHSADNTPSAGAAGAGATTAPDKGYTDLLASAGHTVTRFLTTGTPNVTNLNDNFDLVIISRSSPSTDFEPADSGNWNSITTPIMFMHGYALRNNRMGFTTGATIPDTTGPIKLNVTNPSHPIFAGIALDGANTTVNDFTTGLVPWNGTPQLGISVNTDPITPGGTILATVNGAGAANNGMIIGEFPVGTSMSNGTGGTLSGQRLVFLTGSRENGISSELTGLIDLTPTGEQLLRNSVTYLTGLPEPVLPKLVVNTTTGAVAIRNTTAEPLTFDYYEIASAAGRLNPANGAWNSLSDQNLGAGLASDFNDSNSVNGADLTIWRGAYGVNANGDADGDGDSDGADFLTWQRQVNQSAGPGDGWDEAGGVSSNLLTELFLNGATTIAPGAQVALGNAFVTGGAQDLTFRLARQGGNLALGTVEYVTTGPAAAVPEPASSITLLSLCLCLAAASRSVCRKETQTT